MTSLLYKRQATWGLPSLSPACVQAEALLRFSGTEFKVVVQEEPGSSPTGFHPAYEKDRRLAGSQQCSTEFDAARGILASLTSTSADLDGHLSKSDALLAESMSTLVQRDLEPATLYALWCEQEGFREYKDPYASKLLPPLDFLVAKSEQRRVTRLLSKESSDKIYERACHVLESVSEFLEGKKGYLFGDVPCSTDAFLYGHLLFYRLAPVIPPVLQRKVNDLENLKSYIERISQNYFQEVAPVLDASGFDHHPEEEEMTSNWTKPTSGWAAWDLKKIWEEWKNMDSSSRYWLGGVVGLLLLYSWIRPPFVFMIEQDRSFADDEEETE